MLRFCQNWIFGQKFDFSNSVTLYSLLWIGYLVVDSNWYANPTYWKCRNHSNQWDHIDAAPKPLHERRTNHKQVFGIPLLVSLLFPPLGSKSCPGWWAWNCRRPINLLEVPREARLWSDNKKQTNKRNENGGLKTFFFYLLISKLLGVQTSIGQYSKAHKS